jgi:enoyl-CoA hydratase/carnithine racemase
MYTPADAVPVGYLDAVVAPEALDETAHAAARAWAALPASAYAAQVEVIRRARVGALEAAVASDRATGAGPLAS